MAAPQGNQFWKKRARHGRDVIFSDPEKLRESCYEYFEEVDSNPLREQIIYQGEVASESKNLMQAMTLEGLCVFLGITDQTWYNYKKKDDFLEVILEAEMIMKNQKFTGAAAGQLNPNIIARDLGLKDVNSTELTGKNGGPVETKNINLNMDPEEASRIYREMLNPD